jgi:hypothetical protein
MSKHNRFGQTRAGIVGPTALAIAAAMALAIPQAHAVPFTLGAFDTYGILVNDGAGNGDINTFPVNANIGIGLLVSGKTVNLHNGVVNGKVDCAGSCATFVSGGVITGTQPVSLGGAPSPASLNSSVAAVETAITTAKNLSSTYGAESGSGTAVTINGTTTINASSGFLDASGARVFTATSFSIGNGNTVTINGSASDFVVIDITGNSGNKLDGALTLTGGITEDQVLINFIGVGGSVQGAANGATLHGTFLIPNETVTLNSLTIDGYLFGGQPGTDFHLVSNSFVDQPPWTPTTSTPEPTSMALLAGALAAFGIISRRYRPVARS